MPDYLFEQHLVSRDALHRHNKKRIQWHHLPRGGFAIQKVGELRHFVAALVEALRSALEMAGMRVWVWVWVSDCLGVRERRSVIEALCGALEREVQCQNVWVCEGAGWLLRRSAVRSKGRCSIRMFGCVRVLGCC